MYHLHWIEFLLDADPPTRDARASAPSTNRNPVTPTLADSAESTHVTGSYWYSCMIMNIYTLAPYTKHAYT